MNRRGRKSKSSALKQFERDLAVIMGRVEKGEIEFWEPPMMESLKTTLPGMTEEERSSIGKQLFEIASAFSKELVRRGLPLPGNDPKKPN